MSKLSGHFSLAFLIASSLPVAAQDAEIAPNCAPRELIVSQLADSYGETRKAYGLGNASSLMEMYASDESGTWTITVTLPSGVTCPIAAGHSFEALAKVFPASYPDI